MRERGVVVVVVHSGYIKYKCINIYKCGCSCGRGYDRGRGVVV